MPRTEEDNEFEERQQKLAEFLLGRKMSVDIDGITDKETRAWNTARTMLVASELLDACEYAFTLFSSLSSQDFVAGGDKSARDRLAEAINKAKEADRKEDQEALFARCGADVKEAIRKNRERVL